MSLRRYYPLPRSGPPKSRFPHRRDDAYLAWIRQQPCCVSGVRSGDWVEVPFSGGRTAKVRAVIEAAHVKTRGAGGDDRGNVVPLEMSKHREQHRAGIKTFQRKYEVDLRELAAAYLARYERERPS